MEERAYRSMGITGAGSVALGIVVLTVGIAAGVLAIISGSHLLKIRNQLTF